MASIITLTTDFGLKDSYVGAMKGAILEINPEVKIVDISHAVTPQNVREGAYVLGSAYRYFPKGTIHLVVVDPGVGTGRRALSIRGLDHYFIGPDNGVFSYVISDALEQTRAEPPRQAISAGEGDLQRLPRGFEAVTLTRSLYWRPQVSDTFHGRDIFAPVAAHLSLGVPLEEFGEPVSSVVAFPRPTPVRGVDGSIEGEIIHIDGYGNLITSIKASDLPDHRVETEIGGNRVKGICRSYEEGEGLLSIVGSAGYLEICEKNGSAAARTGAGVGARVVVRKLP